MCFVVAIYMTQVISKYFISEPWLEISNNLVCATNKASDQPDRYSNPFLNAYMNRHAHTEYLKMI